jgi:hypothetical protein
MNQKLFILLILFSTYVFGQEKNTQELRAPLNLKKCVQCIAENPTISLQGVNEIEGFASEFFNVTKNNFIPLTIALDKNGKIISIKIEEDIVYKQCDEINVAGVNELIKKCLGKLMITNKNSTQNIQTTVCFFVNNNNEVILNPIIH